MIVEKGKLDGNNENGLIVEGETEGLTDTKDDMDGTDVSRVGTVDGLKD